MSQQATAEMDWCQAVGPRDLCRPLDEKRRFPTSRVGHGKARQGRPGQARAGQGKGRAWQKHSNVRGPSSLPNGREVIRGFTLPHRSDRTLGQKRAPIRDICLDPCQVAVASSVSELSGVAGGAWRHGEPQH